MDIKGIFQSIGTGIQSIGSYIRSSLAKLFARSSYQNTNESITPLVGRVSTNIQAASAQRTDKAAMRVLQKAEASLRELQQNLPKQLSQDLLSSPELQDSDLMKDIDELANDIKQTKVAIASETKIAAIGDAKVELSQMKKAPISQNASLISSYNKLSRKIAEKAQGISRQEAKDLLSEVKNFIRSIDDCIKDLELAQKEAQTGIRTSEKLAAATKNEAKKYARENNQDLLKLAVKSYVRAKAFYKKNSETVRLSKGLITSLKGKKKELEKVASILKKLSEASNDFSVRLTQ